MVTFGEAVIYSAATGAARSAEGVGFMVTEWHRRTDGDLFVSLAGTVHRNRLALILLAAGAAQAGGRARDAAVTSSPARWIARNVEALRLFLASLSLPRLCSSDAGYRVITEVRQTARRRRRAPRLLRHRLAHRDILRPDMVCIQVRQSPPSVISVY